MKTNKILLILYWHYIFQDAHVKWEWNLFTAPKSSRAPSSSTAVQAKTTQFTYHFQVA